MLYDNHGRVCRKVGNRFFAIPKEQSLTDKLHARSASALRGSRWERVIMQQKGRAYVCVNATGRAARKPQPRFGA